MANQCIHSDVCRAYMKKYYEQEGRSIFGRRSVPFILSLLCPNGCTYYEPIKRAEGLHFKEEKK